MRIPTTLTFLLLTLFASAQIESARIAIAPMDLSEYPEKPTSDQHFLFDQQVNQIDYKRRIASISDEIIKSFVNQENFIVIDLSSINVIQEEKQRQKSIDFLEGHITAQMASEGADYLIVPKYVHINHSVAVRVIQVNTEEVMCEANVEFKSATPSRRIIRAKTAEIISTLKQRCFQIEYVVVKPIEQKKGKTKTVLVLAGHTANVKRYTDVRIYHYTDIVVNEDTISKKTTLALGEVEKVEDDNFSVVKIEKGHKDLHQAFDTQRKLFCEPIPR